MSDLTIQSTSFDWTDPSNRTSGLEMWLFSSIPWVDENAVEHGAGNETDRTFTQRVAGVTNNTTTHRLTIPEWSVTPTVNAYVGRGVRLSFWIVQVIGSSVTPIKQVPGTEAGLQIPTALASITPPNDTFADLIIYNSPSPTLPRDDYYPKSVVDAKIIANIGAGGISGVGAATRLPFFTSFTAVSSDAGLTWNNTTKEFASSLVKMGTGTNANDGVFSSLGASATMIRGADSTALSPTASELPMGVFQTWRSGNYNAFGFLSALYKSGQGDGYGWFQFLKYEPNMTGFPTGVDYNMHGMRSYVYLNPSNVGSCHVFGYNLMQVHRTVAAGVRCVALQVEPGNLTSTDADTDATTQNSTIALSITGAGTAHNSVAILVEANQTNAFATIMRPITDGVYRYGMDFKGFTYTPQGTATFTQTSGTAVGVGTKWLLELAVGDQTTRDGINWYTVLTVPDDTHFTFSPVFAESTVAGATIIKTLAPFRMSAVSYIIARNIANTSNFRIVGVDQSDHVRLDPDGMSVVVGSGARQLTDATGNVVFESDINLVNGLNSNISVASAGIVLARSTGPTGAFSVGGFAPTCKVIYLFNVTAQTMTIVNEDASSTAANRIDTMTGGNVVLAATRQSFATLVYSAIDSRWILSAQN